ncbi:calcium-binding protein [Flexibacterium corallicola]|uniref:calcium-binding protein n=1 Tax=Flexibacterium corallicola TaxID=3037259 RepID=UPI00286F3A40|nr:calcium-binding protein [Pseudovibrio sp. M1P-2-3]
MATKVYKGNDNKDDFNEWTGTDGYKYSTLNYYAYGYGGDDYFKFSWMMAPSGSMAADFQSLHAYMGEGNDYIEVDLSDPSNYSASLDMDIDGEQGDDIIDVSAVSDKGNNSTIILRGGSGDDTIDGTKGADTIYGDYETSDTPALGEISVKSGMDIPNYIDTAYDSSLSYNDFIDAGAGDDLVYGGFGDDLIYGGKGDDTLYGGVGNDTIYGDKGDDTIYGGDGDDMIFGGVGSDTIYGGDGNDYIHVGDRTGSDIDTVYGGAGADTIITGGMKADYLYGEDGQPYDWGGFSAEKGAETGLEIAQMGLEMVGMANPMLGVMFGVAGSFATQALSNALSGDGDNTYTVTDSSDYVSMKDFNPLEDQFIYTATLTDGDTLGYFKGMINESRGTYELWSDVTQQGNGGLIAQMHFDHDLIDYLQETSATGASETTIAKDLAAGVMNTGFSVTYHEGHYHDDEGDRISDDALSQVVNTDPDTGADITLQDSLDGMGLEDGQTMLMTGAYSGQFMIGQEVEEAGDLYMVGTNYGDAMYAKNPVTHDTQAKGYMYGFGGDDVIEGGDAKDHIFGGEGDDTMTGYGDADTFVFEANAGNDTVTDFTVGEDTIRFYGDDYPDLAYDDLTITQVEDDTTTSGYSTTVEYGDNQITLEDVTSGSLSESDFVFS